MATVRPEVPGVPTPRTPGARVVDPERVDAVLRLELTGHDADAELDAVVHSLAAGCGVPIAVVNLVLPGLQVYPAEVGVGASCTTVPDALSFCAEVVETARELVVPDALDHPVYRQNPLVAGGHLRAYAGEPLVHAGQVVGAVSIFDTVPRRFTDAELTLLRAQARLASAVLALRDAARLDDLTRLPNRRALTASGPRLVAAGAAVLFIDVDGFKAVNDVHGHDVGDAVLRDLGRALKQRLRRSGARVGRWGGDEFLAVVPAGVDPVHAAGALTEKLAGLGPAGVTVTVTVGVAPGALGNDWDELIVDAGAAARAGKRAGKSTVVLCTEEVRRQRRLHDDTEQALRRGLRLGEVGLHYQPLRRVSDGALVELEALARWDRDGQPVSPDLFIPVAESSGVIVEFGRQVLDTACRQLAAWRDEHDGAQELRVWVNVSARELSAPGFVEGVRDTLARYALPPDRLGVEVTETVAAVDPDAALRTLSALRAAGVPVALDDFGSGHSSLARLRALPVDVLKLDRGFVADLGQGSSGDLAVVRAVVELGHALGLPVVAEGVERAEDAAALVGAGCDLLQGWHVARPVPPERVPALVGWTTGPRAA